MPKKGGLWRDREGRTQRLLFVGCGRGGGFQPFSRDWVREGGARIKVLLLQGTVKDLFEKSKPWHCLSRRRKINPFLFSLFLSI